MLIQILHMLKKRKQWSAISWFYNNKLFFKWDTKQKIGVQDMHDFSLIYKKKFFY